MVAIAAHAQTVLPRITENVDDATRTTLKGSVPLIARTKYDQGEAPAATQMTGVRLVFSRTATQEAALDKYLKDLQKPASSNYHKWLTPAQFGKLYGPADSDIAAVTAWLQAHGLTVSSVSSGRTGISFSGSVSQMEETFHTSIHSFKVKTTNFIRTLPSHKFPRHLQAL